MSSVDAVVFFTMDAEDGSVPLIDKLVRRVLVGLVSIGGTVLVPIGIVVLPVGEPVLLGLGVHGFKIESTVMGDETLEALVVMTGEIIDGESTE